MEAEVVTQVPSLFDWLSHHTDLVVLLISIFGGFLWMNGKFNEIEKDIIMIKTVMIVKNIMPSEIATMSQKPTKE